MPKGESRCFLNRLYSYQFLKIYEWLGSPSPLSLAFGKLTNLTPRLWTMYAIYNMVCFINSAQSTYFIQHFKMLEDHLADIHQPGTLWNLARPRISASSGWAVCFRGSDGLRCCRWPHTCLIIRAIVNMPVNTSDLCQRRFAWLLSILNNMNPTSVKNTSPITGLTPSVQLYATRDQGMFILHYRAHPSK